MSITLFVGNLSWNTDSEELKSIFSSFGSLKEAKVEKFDDGKSKGFGFVVFEEEADAIKAMQEVSGKEIDGRNIKVRLSEESSNGRKVFVGGLSFAASEEDLRSMFDGVGTVLDATIIRDRETRRSRGFGFVTFAEASDAQKACEEMDGKEVDGRSLKVSIAEQRSRE